MFYMEKIRPALKFLLLTRGWYSVEFVMRQNFIMWPHTIMFTLEKVGSYQETLMCAYLKNAC